VANSIGRCTWTWMAFGDPPGPTLGLVVGGEFLCSGGSVKASWLARRRLEAAYAPFSKKIPENR